MHQGIHQVRKLSNCLLFALALCASSKVFSQDAERYENVSVLNSPIQLHQGETRTVPFGDDWKYVKKIFVQMEASGRDATVEVYANGDHKGTIHIPAVDPSYVVTIAESIKSIQLRHTGGGTVQVRSLTAVLEAEAVDADEPQVDGDSIHWGKYPQVDRYLEQNEATSLAKAALVLVQAFHPYCDLETEYVRYMLPINSVAGRLYAEASATGVLSGKTRDGLEALAGQIANASPLINNALKRDLTFEIAVRMWALKAKIEDLLD